jgi:hypothetical protein
VEIVLKSDKFPAQVGSAKVPASTAALSTRATRSGAPRRPSTITRASETLPRDLRQCSSQKNKLYRATIFHFEILSRKIAPLTGNLMPALICRDGQNPARPRSPSIIFGGAGSALLN